MKLAAAAAAFGLLLGAAEAARANRHAKKASLLTDQTLQHESRSKTMAELHPFYHTTSDIHDRLETLATKCSGMTLKTVQGSSDDGRSRSIDVVTIRKPGASPVNKNFALFGEHSRELISPESGLHLVRTLCGETDESARAAAVLDDSEFQIVVNGNPESRRRVEEGDFCLRVDPDGVDLNRNWDEEWEAAAVMDPDDTNPGPRPFSEPETRVFKQLVTEYNPTTFLTVHSGTKGMYMPWAYDMDHLAKRNQPQMMQILKDLDRDHCQCPFGAAGREVGYSCPGTCLDWVYDKLNTPFAFAFEIYTGPDWSDMLRERWNEKMRDGGALIQANSTLAHEHFKDLFEKHPSGFVQLRSEQTHSTSHLSNDECFAQFNPSSEEEYRTTVDNWSAAYLDMAAMVVKSLKSGAALNATAGVDLRGI